MAAAIITSPGNSLVKLARSLKQKKFRSETGLFLVEGIHHIGEALDAGWELQSVLYAPDLLTSRFAKDLVSHHSGIAQPVSVEIMTSLADKENPQGILAVGRQRNLSINGLGSPKITVALVAPQDPGNVGTILRTMDAVDAEALFLLEGGVELYHPTVIRSSMGAIFWKSVVQSSFYEFADWARAGGVQLIGTSAHAEVDYLSLVPRSPWVLVLGSEQKGLSPDQIKLCDAMISLPMQGKASSLNLAVAAGILLYALKK